MRIAIWHQFSSNHSSHFTVVGRFATEEQAKEAAEKIRELLARIIQWRDSDREWSEIYYEENIVTPPEVEFSQESGVEWDSVPIDWVRTMEDIEKAIYVSKSDVFVTNPGGWETASSPRPIEGILTKFGGKASHQTSGDLGYLYLRIHLTCNAPDETSARNIYQQVNDYLRQHEKRPPWQLDDTYGSLSAEGNMSRDNRQIGFQLVFWRLGETFPALIAFLDKYGCSDIEYAFTEELEWPR